MANINLLPEEFRSKEKKERAQVGKKPKVVEVTLTTPAKTGSVAGKGFWNKLLGKFKKNRIREAAGDHPAVLPKVVSPVAPKLPKQDQIFSIGAKKDSRNSPLEKRIAREDLKKSSAIPPLPEPLKEDSDQPEKKFSPASPSPLSEANLEKSKEPSKQIKDVKPKITGIHSVEVEKKGIASGSLTEIIKKIIYKITRKPTEGEIRVDLIPERLATLKEMNWSKVVRIMLVSVGLSIGITIIGYLFLLDRGQQQEDDFINLQLSIASLKAEIAALKDEQQEVLFLQQKLQLADGLINDHVYWTKFLNLLETYTLDGVSYDGLNSQAGSQEIILNGTASDLPTLFWQREVLRDAADFALSAETKNIQINNETGEVNFSLLLSVKPTAWRQ